MTDTHNGSFAALIGRMTQAACAGDGAAVRACFTPDGVYHDIFYGAFEGDAIVDLIEGHFHRDAADFRWDVHDPVSDGAIGYARYIFSYSARLPAVRGHRALFEGVAVCRLEDGAIARYSEVANTAPALAAMGFAPERCHKLALRENAALAARAEAQTHLRGAAS